MLQEMAPRPGRLRNTLLLLSQVFVTIIVGETFRLPQLSLFVILAFLLSANDAVSNASSSIVTGLTMTAATGLTIVILMFSLSEPAIRLPCMMLLTLAAGFLSQAATMGPLCNLLLFWIVYMAMNADLAESAGYGVPAFVGNTTDSIIPSAAFIPPEEAMLQNLLWTVFLFLLAIALLAIVNKLAGHDPLASLRSCLAARMNAVADICLSDENRWNENTDVLKRFARSGVAELRAANDLASRLHPELLGHQTGPALIRTVGLLVMTMAAWRRYNGSHDEPFLQAAAQLARCCANAIMHRSTQLESLAACDNNLNVLANRFRDDPLRYPLAIELARNLTISRALLLDPEPATHGFAADVRAAAHSYFKPDAFTNPAYPHAAVRIVLSVAICYAITRVTSWQGIHTCVGTCFIVSLSTVGDSAHKMALRVGGALIGAACGIGTILWLMPYMTDLTDLLLAIIPVTLLAGWIKCGSPRISYAGVQVSMAYFMTILHNYGPTLDMESGRDRVVGILIGNVVVYAVSVTLWPVSVGPLVRRHLVNAIRSLADLMGSQRASTDPQVDLDQRVAYEKFDKAITTLRGAALNAHFEAGLNSQSTINSDIVIKVQNASISIVALNDIGLSANAAATDHVERIKCWLVALSDWITSSPSEGEFFETPPAPPVLPKDAGREVWFNILDTHLRQIRGDLVHATKSSLPSVAER
ncbi:FUSC family protein [Acetobacter sacchari]|uniref:FUSC family protein n=1 Tax=Acetobacter sacchari TaxID=2661687 RepID=A0ABS3M143_9PROT|nr:FUSC family protein [Acetobacter sacchari]MBO1361863.1 FUSC family protein [Acetobacter sacchari]